MLIGGGPMSKTSVSILGGTLLVVPGVSLPMSLGGAGGTPGAGSGSLPLVIPNVSALIGANLNFQGVFLDAGATFSISMSNAVEMWIG